MSPLVYWIVTVKIHPGEEARFKELSRQLIELTRAEPGTLNYEWSLSADGRTCHIYERYIDSAAVLIHSQRSHELVGQLFTVSDLISFVIYGAPNEEVKRDLAEANPIYMQPLGGFSCEEMKAGRS